MKTIPARLALGLILVLAAVLPARAIEDRVITVSAEDKAMAQAIQQARAKLPHFWAVMAAPKHGESGFCLKIKIVDGDAVEYFWCGDIKPAKGGYTVVVDNDPELVKNVKIGQRITVREADISDWLYMRDDKMIGNYTVRPLMKSMSKEEVEFLKDKLGELPKD